MTKPASEVYRSYMNQLLACRKIKDNGVDANGAGNVVYITLHELPAPLADTPLDFIFTPLDFIFM